VNTDVIMRDVWGHVLRTNGLKRDEGRKMIT